MNTLIAISGLGVFCLIAEIFNLRKLLVPMAILGLLAILGLTISEFNTPASFYNNMIVVDKFSVAFSSLFIILTIFLVALSGDFYKDHPFTLISKENPDLKQVVNTNKCILYLERFEDKLYILSLIDNLVKGASGQAVQNMNLMFGLTENAGLHLKSIGF